MIWFDLDGVVFDVLTPLSRRLEEEFGPAVGPVRSYRSVGSAWPERVAPLVDARAAELFAEPALYEEAAPYEHMAATVAQVANARALGGYVTRRGLALAEVTVEGLRKAGLPVAPVRLLTLDSDAKSAAIGPRAVLVEDNPADALEVAGSGRDVFLLDRPYNQGVFHPRVNRIYSALELQHRLQAVIGALCYTDR